MSEVILSAELSDLTNAENTARTAHLRKFLDGIFCRSWWGENIGSYHGVRETSFSVKLSEADTTRQHPETFDDLGTQVLELAATAFECFSQESVLYVDDDDDCYLLYGSGMIEHIGKKVTVLTVHGHDAWTLELRNNRAWTVI